MRLFDLGLFFLTSMVLLGVWQFIWLRLMHYSYKTLRETDERFLDFCVRVYNTSNWKLRKKLKIDWFYNSKAFSFFVILRGIIFLCIACVVVIAFFTLKNKGLDVFLYEKF